MGTIPVTMKLNNFLLTMSAGVGAANGGDGGATGHDKLIKLAFILLVFRLGQHHILNVQPGRKGELAGQEEGLD
jgi:hypothetical protein